MRPVRLEALGGVAWNALATRRATIAVAIARSKMPNIEALKEEILANRKLFDRMLPQLLREYRGRFALLRHEKIVDIFATILLAKEQGDERFSDGLFSIQEITDETVDLGIHSHAVHLGEPRQEADTH